MITKEFKIQYLEDKIKQIGCEEVSYDNYIKYKALLAEYHQISGQKYQPEEVYVVIRQKGENGMDNFAGMMEFEDFKEVCYNGGIR